MWGEDLVLEMQPVLCMLRPALLITRCLTSISCLIQRVILQSGRADCAVHTVHGSAAAGLPPGT